MQSYQTRMRKEQELPSTTSTEESTIIGHLIIFYLSITIDFAGRSQSWTINRIPFFSWRTVVVPERKEPITSFSVFRALNVLPPQGHTI
eukprot:scaffold8140_cov79-Cylindrotheca_fusiformis.AAC.2